MIRRPSPHPVRPAAYNLFEIPLWQAIFERFQPEYTRCPLEVRHPFVDIRLLRFLLAVPVLPWCRNKYLLRRSMRGVLPEAILKRPKTPLTNDPWTKHILELGLPPVSWTPALEQYVDRSRLERAPANDPNRFWIDFRVRSLGYWLRNLHVPETVPQTVEPSLQGRSNA
jgi:asparagine synthase (glutamine-hydrolysing)